MSHLNEEGKDGTLGGVPMGSVVSYFPLGGLGSLLQSHLNEEDKDGTLGGVPMVSPDSDDGGLPEGPNAGGLAEGLVTGYV